MTGAELSKAVPELREQLLLRPGHEVGGVGRGCRPGSCSCSRPTSASSAAGRRAGGPARSTAGCRWPSGCPTASLGWRRPRAGPRWPTAGWRRSAQPRRPTSSGGPVGPSARPGPRWPPSARSRWLSTRDRAGSVPGDEDAVRPTAPWVALLPALDPTTMGWQGRGWYLGPHGPRLFDRSGNAGPTVWVDGHIVGGWAQRPDGEVVHQAPRGRRARGGRRRRPSGCRPHGLVRRHVGQAAVRDPAAARAGGLMLTTADAAALADRFDVGADPSLSGPVARGEQGQIWRLTTSRGAWAVKEPFEAPPPDEAEEEAAFQEAAVAAGVPAPPVVRPRQTAPSSPRPARPRSGSSAGSTCTSAAPWSTLTPSAASSPPSTRCPSRAGSPWTSGTPTRSGPTAGTSSSRSSPTPQPRSRPTWPPTATTSSAWRP